MRGVEGSIGQKFCSLLVTGDGGRDRFGKILVWVECDCGTPRKRVRLAALRGGGTKSCGCRVITANAVKSKEVELGGVQVSLVDLAKRACVSLNVLRSRVYIGWSIEEAISIPLHGRRVKGGSDV